MKTRVFHKAGKRAISLAFALIFTLCLVLHSVRPALAYESQADYDEGYNQGLNDGYQNGYNQGVMDGQSLGYQEGYNQGQQDCLSGHDAIYQDGYNAGFEAGKQEPPTGFFTQDDVNDARNAGYLAGLEAGQTAGYQDGFEAGKTAGYEEGYTAGYNKGKEDGHAEGYDEGYTDGKEDGRAEGYDEGKTDGHTEGYEEGYQDGVNSGTATESDKVAPDANDAFQNSEGIFDFDDSSTAFYTTNISIPLSAIGYFFSYYNTQKPNAFSMLDGLAYIPCSEVADFTYRIFRYGLCDFANKDGASGARTLQTPSVYFKPTEFGQVVEVSINSEISSFGCPVTDSFTVRKTIQTTYSLAGKYFCVILKADQKHNGKDFYLVHSWQITESHLSSDYLVLDTTSSALQDFSGYNKGHADGYASGVADGRADITGVSAFLPGIFGGVTRFFSDMLGGMTIFGISALDVFLTFVMIALVSFVIRFVK